MHSRARCRFLLHWWTQAKCPRATKAMPFAFKRPTAPRSTLDNLHYYRSFRPVDIRFYVQYEHNAKRSGVQSFISSVTPADDCWSSSDQGSLADVMR